MRKSLYILLLLSQSILADAPKFPIDESHLFKVRAEVNYRCYSNDGKQFLDSRNKEICNGQDQRKIFIDKIVKLNILKEPSPDGPIYYGSFLQEDNFKGRKFTLYFGIAKAIVNKKINYTLRMQAHDDEPTTRQTALTLNANQVIKFNPASIEYTSANGQPEIQYNVSIQPIIKE